MRFFFTFQSKSTHNPALQWPFASVNSHIYGEQKTTIKGEYVLFCFFLQVTRSKYKRYNLISSLVNLQNWLSNFQQFSRCVFNLNNSILKICLSVCNSFSIFLINFFFFKRGRRRRLYLAD